MVVLFLVSLRKMENSCEDRLAFSHLLESLYTHSSYQVQLHDSTIFLDALTSFLYKIKLRINPYIVFIQILGHRHTDKEWRVEPEFYIIVLVNTILKQEEIHIALEIHE